MACGAGGWGTQQEGVREAVAEAEGGAEGVEAEVEKLLVSGA